MNESIINIKLVCIYNNSKLVSFSCFQAVERRGEMIVRILEPRCIGGKQAVEAAQKLMSKGDARHTVQVTVVLVVNSKHNSNDIAFVVSRNC